MGKRSNFARIEKDFYPTPYKAIIPLLPHLPECVRYIEPCVGKGDLITHLSQHGHICISQSDHELDVQTTQYDVTGVDYFITNPPWTRSILHNAIENLRNQRPTWLIFDADWMHTKQAIPYLPYCSKIVSVGRVKWIPNSQWGGLDNVAWYLFEKDTTITTFIGPT